MPFAQPPQPRPPLLLEVGRDLVAIVEAHGGGGLLQRLQGISKRWFHERGVELPPFMLRDPHNMPPRDIRFWIYDQVAWEATLGEEVALNSFAARAEVAEAVEGALAHALELQEARLRASARQV